MAIQIIDVGRIANDGTGDDLREAFIKINNNFQELDLRDDEQTSAVNLGTVGEGVFYNKVNYELQFKKLAAGTDVTLASDNEKITINANGGLKTLTVNADTGNIVLSETDTLTLSGGNDIQTTISGNTLTIDYTGLVGIENDKNPVLGGDLNAAGFNISNVGILNAVQVSGSFIGNVTGNVTGLVHNIDIRELDSYFSNYWNMGNIKSSADSILQWIMLDYPINMGTIANPSLISIDMGTI